MLVAVGACTGAAAGVAHGTVAGGVAWLVALAIACVGLGIAFEQLTRQRVSMALTLAAGLAILLAGSVVVARMGWLGRGVQLAAVAAGIAASGLPRLPRAGSADGAGSGIAMAAVGGLAALLLVVFALIRPAAAGDAGDHVFLVKRLWDLGTIAGSHGDALPVVGEAYAAWAAGAGAARVFGAGLCAVLVIFIVVAELSCVEARLAQLVLVLVVLSVVLRPIAGGEWPAVAFHLAAILSLRGPIAERRIAWHTLLAAIALGLVRDEYWPLATTYAFAALAVSRPVWSRREIAAGMLAWFGAAVAILIAMGTRGSLASIRALAVMAGLPLAALMLRMLGGAAWRSGLGVMCAAVASYQLAIVSYAVPSTGHAAEAVFATWFAVGIGGVIAIARLPADMAPVSWLRTAVTALVISLISLTELGLPMFRAGERRSITAQLSGAVAAWRDRVAFGGSRSAEDVHAAQLQVPAGAAIGFWGRSAARLEFGRNPIRDVAGDGSPTAVVTEARLHALPWWIVEDLPISRRRDPWSGDRTHSSDVIDASQRMELRGTIGAVRIYRVRGPDTAR